MFGSKIVLILRRGSSFDHVGLPLTPPAIAMREEEVKSASSSFFLSGKRGLLRRSVQQIEARIPAGA